jgi:hypothetical protein
MIKIFSFLLVLTITQAAYTHTDIKESGKVSLNQKPKKPASGAL